MHAIVEIAGTQFKVAPSQKLFVPHLKSDVGSTVRFDKVLAVESDTAAKIGKPFIAGSFVEAKVLRHTKDETVIVFKKKRRKGYRVRNGHRQQYTEIEITKLA